MTEREHPINRDRDDAPAVRPYLNPLPRSVARRHTYALLDGEWRFSLDLEYRGLAERWYLGHSWPGVAPWPGSVESHISGARDAGRHARTWEDTVVAWYERDFEAPSGWTEASGSVLQVTFGACGYETRVWLNGRPLVTVEGEETHIGAYTSFSYELPPRLLRPSNRLTVRVAASLDPETPRGKQESRLFKRGGIWYQTYTGGVRSVWLEPVELNRLRSRVGVVSSVEDRLVEFELTTRIHNPGPYTLRLVVARRGEGRPLAVAEHVLRLEAGEKRQRVVLELPEAKLWSPESPYLYHLTAQLLGLGTGVSQIETRFGLRKLETRGRHVYLNNEPLYLDGILYQPGMATWEQMRRHMLAMKDLGCNLVRVHIAGVDPRVYELADELGMLLWVETPSPHSSSERSRANHWAELKRMLVAIGAHPSVAFWSLYNEDWGAEDVATNEETRGYVARAYDYLRLNHPQLLVIDTDGWHHLSVEGRLTSDLLTAHIYVTELERWEQLLDRLVSGDAEGVTGRPLVVGDPFFYRGQLPLVVSEWGGFGWSGYGGPQDAESKAEKIRAFKRSLRGRAIAGDVYTQATSIEDEDNGVLDAESGALGLPPGVFTSSPPPSLDDGGRDAQRVPG
jgi:hypothetical protein